MICTPLGEMQREDGLNRPKGYLFLGAEDVRTYISRV